MSNEPPLDQEEDPFVKWDEKDIEAALNPGIGNFASALFPALYAWQLYGGWVGLLIYMAILICLAAVSWRVVLGRIRPKHSVWYKGTIIGVVFLALALSALEAGHY